MELDRGDDIDTRCWVCQHEGEKGEAVGWTYGSDGKRYYVCADHAEDLTRFGTALDALPDTPAAQPCQGCHRLTLVEDLTLGSKRCPSCEGPEGVLNTVIREEDGSMSVDEAVQVLDQLVEEEDVPPETAAAAVEQVTGVPMEPAEDADTT